MNIRELTIQEARFLKNNFDITLKRDGTLVYYTGKNLVSKRGIIRNDRFGHIVRALRQADFPSCVGEMYIENGNVFDISRSDNWHKARYMIFDLLDSELSLADRQARIDDLIDKLNSEFITKPVRFPDLETAWDYVTANDQEGLVLKSLNAWYKIKILRESKVRISTWERGHDKGTFILTDGNRISGTSMDLVKRYLAWEKEGRKVMAEIEYPFVTENGHYFQPRLRRLFCAGV